MNKETQQQVFDETVNQMRSIMLSKGDDYANDDRLSNFKKVAIMTNTTPEMVVLNLIATKVARLSELLTGKTPKNESVEDSILDLANYTLLLKMIRHENIS